MPPSSTSIRHSSLKGYLAGAIGTTAMLSASQGEAAIVAVNIGSGTLATTGSNAVVSASASFGSLYSSKDGFMFFLGANDGTSSIYKSVSGPSFGYAQFLSAGTTIGDGSLRGGPDVDLGTGEFYFGMRRNTFTSDVNGNIGFQTTSGNFGWANINWNHDGKFVTVNSAYVQDNANLSITVGDTGVSAVPEPSRALLALAGMAGVALRRRRKQAA